MANRVVIVPRDEADERHWRVTHEIADLLAGLPWVLVGGQMVTILEARVRRCVRSRDLRR